MLISGVFLLFTASIQSLLPGPNPRPGSINQITFIADSLNTVGITSINIQAYFLLSSNFCFVMNKKEHPRSINFS